MYTRMSPAVRAILLPLFIILTLIFLCPTTPAGDRRRVRAVSPPAPPLSFTFLDGGLLDAGTIAGRGGKQRSTITVKTVRLRIGDAASRGTVTVRAFLETPDPRCTIRIDGLPLTTAPRVIRRNAPVGVAFTHRIEYEVPISVPDGPLQAAIGWEATSE
jgi:hypothetical protein